MTPKFLCFLILFSIACAATQDTIEKEYKIVCYLSSWANYRHGDGAYFIENIEARLCTHLVYSFAKLDKNQIVPYDPFLELRENFGNGAFERLQIKKLLNRDLKIMIAIGGWNAGSTKYSQMASDPTSRATFVKSVIEFCKEHGFDGLDVDWEYPANRGGIPEDKKNFALLLKELKEAFKPHGFVLSAAVSAGKVVVESAYDVPEISKYLDFINVMTHDFHGSWEKTTGHNAPLYDSDSAADKTLNIDYAINNWIASGAPKEKLVLGIGFYGRSFTLRDSAQTSIGAPAIGPGKSGPFTQEPGMLGYNEICLYLKDGWTEVFVPKVEAPYAYSGDQWVGYDNRQSIGLKVDYLMQKGLGGAMVWSLDTDDFRGECHGYTNPLLKVINIKLTDNYVFIPTDNPNPRTRSTPRSTTSVNPPVEEFQCVKAGYFRDPHRCDMFHLCLVQGQGFDKHSYYCGSDAAFDENTNTCTYKHMIPGCE